MSTPLRDETPGYHHVVARGNNKRKIFLDERDHVVFLLMLERLATKYGWRLLAYCLMDNHYHLVLWVGERGLSDGMCELNGGYAQAFNAEHGRINHLFGKRFWNSRIKTDASMLNAVRYVVQNPRRAGERGPLEASAWTSYAATIGLAFSRIRLARDEVLEFFGRTPERAVEEFRVFCAATPLASRVSARQVRWQPP
jgi:REP element-mobilizing transposase RayT